MSALSDLALRVARDAASKAPRALATVNEWRHARTQLEGAGEAARTASKEGVLVTLRVEGARGVGSAEEWVGPAEVGAPRSALVRAAVALAREAKDKGSLRGALVGLGDPPTRTVEVPTPREIFAALRAAARGARALSADISIETTRTFVALAGEDGERVHVHARTGVVLHGELDACELGLSCDFDDDRAQFLSLVRAAARDARSRAVSRTNLVALGSPRTLLLSPQVVTWILHGALVSGLASARPGARAFVAPWLLVDDRGTTHPDEQGVVPSPVALVRDGRFERAPFRAFDGSGRTRRDARTAATRAEIATLVLGAKSEKTRRLSLLSRDAHATLGEVASADPLPGGRVHVIAHASRGVRAAGLASVRVSPHELLAKTVAVSREQEPVSVHDQGVLAPWVLVKGLVASSLRSDR